MLDIEPRLVNWGRAMRVHPIRLRCLSLEGRYRSPQRNMWEAPIPAFGGTIDMLDAWEVERAVITLPVPVLVLLRLHYVAHAHPFTIRRIVRRSGQRHFGDFGYELLLAQKAAAYALTLSLQQSQSTARRKARIAIDNPLYVFG
jgi:hypothetical protein